MAWYDNFFRNVSAQDSVADSFAYASEQADWREEAHYLTEELREAKEDLLKIADAFDSIGWAPLDADKSNEINLDTVKKAAETSRALYAINPFVNRGVNARVGYIWGRSVVFDGVDSISEKIELNRKKMFNATAYEEFERALATDGNVFTALPIGEAEEDETAHRVPLAQVFDAVSNPRDREEIWYYRREYVVKKTNQDGVTKETKVIKYYASMEYYQKLQRTGKALPKRWKDAGVEQDFVIQHVAVNKQIGWRWGMPDITPVIFWAKAYKEYLEDNATLVKAYSRIAWKVQAANAGGAGAAAAQVRTPPTIDPITGEQRYVGATSVSGPGTDLTPVAANGSTVDFDKGSALAAAIASGLQVSKVVITSDPGSGNRATAETLDLPTLKAMESRQQLHTERFLALFEFWGAEVTPAVQKNNKREISEEKVGERTDPGYAIVTWPQIESDSTKDRVTAIGTAVELGIIYKQEARKEALDTLGIAPYKPWDDLPTMEDDPAAKQQMELEQQNAEVAFEREQKVVAAQGVSGGVSAQGKAQGTANSARANRAKDSKSA